MSESIALAFLLTAGAVSARERAEADRQWTLNVRKIFTSGKSSVTTPLEHRAQLAVKVAAELGQRCHVVGTGTGFKVELIGSRRSA